ncbi:ABC transporter permease [bacterium]|nr:ABC transporter permease [bacterium]
MREILVFVRKEFRQVFRDTAMVRIIFVVSTVQLFVFAYATNTDLRNVRFAVLDGDRTEASRDLVAAFRATREFVPGPVAHDGDELEAFLLEGRAELALRIPQGYARDLLRGDTPAVAVTVDGTNSSRAGRAAGYAGTIIRAETARSAAERGLVIPGSEGAPAAGPRIEGVTRFFYNPELESRYYMVPAILVLLVSVISSLLTGMSVVREREIGTLDQLLVSPLTPAQIIAGKTIPFAVISFVQFFFSTALAILAFRLPLAGSVPVLLLGGIVYLLVTLGVGLLASTVSSTQQQAMFAVWFFLVFGILMSGFFYPIENMPPWARELTRINPLRYMMNIVRGVFLKGAGFGDLRGDLAMLTALGLAVFSAAAIRFRKRTG